MPRHRLFILIGIVLIALMLASCGESGPTSSAPQEDSMPAAGQGNETGAAQTVATPGSSLAATPVGRASSGSGAGNDQVVPCAQLLPADDVATLLGAEPVSASEQGVPGSTICTWRYVPRSATQESVFEIEAGTGDSAVARWESERKMELSGQAPDIVVNPIDGLGDESYTWASQPGAVRVVYARQGLKTLIMRYTTDVLYLGTESGIIDYAQRFFERF